jgi:hypothetical protein
MPHSDGSHSHEGSIAVGARFDKGGHNFSGAAIISENCKGVLAYAYAFSRAGVFMSIHPSEKTIEEVLSFEVWCANKAVGKAKRHGGVICPCPRRKTKVSACHHFGNQRKAVAGLEFNRRAQCISDCEPDHGA